MSYTDTFPALTFQQFLDNFISALQAGTPAISDFSPGSVSLAFGEAVAGNDLAIQSLAYRVYNFARLGTSVGLDVDSFVADFGLVRYQPTATTMILTLNRTLTSQVQYEAVGAICQASIGGVQFQLIEDDSLSAWDFVTSKYKFPVGVSSISVRIQCTTLGSQGNVPANSLTQIVSGFPGVTSITNPSAGSNGQDQETDTQLKARFVEFLDSLSKANRTAISLAIESVSPAITFQIINAKHFNGSDFPGGFDIVADDGTGAIPSATIDTIRAAVDVVVALGISFDVDAPTNEAINVVVEVTPVAGFSFAGVQAAVIASMTKYINTRGTGVNVAYATLANVLSTTTINGANCVFAYTGLLVNGVAADFVILQTQLARSGSFTVTQL